MSARPVADSRVRYATWRWTPTGEAWSSGAERQLSSIMADGTWCQHTQPLTRPLPIHRFGLEQRVWHRFAERERPVDLQLRYQQRTLRIWGPPNRLLRMTPEWTVAATIPSHAAGQTLLSLTYAAPHLPSGHVRDWLRQLLAMPPLTPRAPQGEWVYFSGDLLLSFLKPALGQLKQRQSRHGEWRAVGPRLQPFNPREPLGGGSGDADGADPDLAPAVPMRLRYFPATIERPDKRHWQALWYESDRRVLTCVAGQGFCALQLPKPLHRYFRKMHFGPVSHTLVFHEVPHQMQEALCYFQQRS